MGDADAMNLNGVEARSLALSIVSSWALHDDGAEWEDYPLLGEHAFERLQTAIVRVGADLAEQGREHDRANGVDSALLKEQARG